MDYGQNRKPLPLSAL